MDLNTALNQFSTDLTARASLESEKAQKMERLRLYDISIAETRDAGKTDVYLRLRAERDAEEKELPALCKALEEPVTSVTCEQILSLWEKEAHDRNGKLSKLSAAYEKVQRDAFSIFEQMIELQNDSLELRYRATKAILTLTGEEDKISSVPDPDYEKMFVAHVYTYLGMAALKLLPKSPYCVHLDGKWIYPDAAYFVCSGNLPESQKIRYTRIADRELSTPRR